jgi:UDP-N-acetylmuramate--alanine ligase
MDWERCRRPHLIGIGGIGVSGVARALHARGLDVRGSDVRESSITLALRAQGVRVTIGQRAENLGDADTVVWSTAVPETNPERRAAVERGLQVRHRSEVLGALLDGRPSVGVLGTHGKGTTAAAITWLLEAGGRAPGFVIGGLLLNYDTNARWPTDGPVVAEIDESDGSLVNVPTQTVVINNLEADHLNYYTNGLEDVLARFQHHFERHPGIDLVVANTDDPGARAAVTRAGRAFVGFGLSDDPAVTYRATDLVVDGLTTRFTVRCEGRTLGPVHLRLPGRYNVSNAIGAIATAHRLGVPFADIARGVESFRGLENRFTVVEAGRMTVVKDYISHPTGIRRVLEAAREGGRGPITAVFKPYRFTMVNYLQDDYAVAFRDAAHTVVTELYPAGEVPIPGIDTEYLCDRIRGGGSAVTFVPQMDEIVDHLLTSVAPGGQVIFFGGDDLFAVADRYAAAVSGR